MPRTTLLKRSCEKPNNATVEWTRTDADRKAVAAGCWFDLEAAERVREFMRTFLRHSKGDFAGQPFELQEWQWREVIAPLFGWKRPDGTRRYRRCSLWVAKKNGKSTLAAALILFGLLADGESGAEVYSAAADRNQASIIYREAANMVRQSPGLGRRLDIIETTKRIVHKPSASCYEVLSKESKKTGHGINASEVVIDELHVVDRETHETLRYAGAARRQPLFIEISTAGNDTDSLGYERYLYAKRVLNGDIEDPELLAVIYEAKDNDSWAEPEQWRKANPSLGVTIKEEAFAADFREAKQGSAAQQASFKQLRLNLWQDSVSVWFPVEVWDSCSGPLPDSALIGKPCWGGLDLANKMDLVALVWLFELQPETYYLKPCFWAPSEADSQRQRNNKALLRPWMLGGHIIEVPESNVIDYGMVQQRVLDDFEKYNPNVMAFDPWNAAAVINNLTQKIDLSKFKEFGQTIKNYNGPMKEFEKLAKSKKIRHDGNPVMRFCVKNVMVKRDDNDNQRPAKGKSADKIDGVTAALMALGLRLTDASGEENWYTPGVLSGK